MRFAGTVGIIICAAMLLTGCASSDETSENPPDGTNPELREPTTGFRGHGNEPFWLLDVDFEKGTIRFKTMTGDVDRTVPLPNPIHRPDIGSLIYRSEVDGNLLDVTILRRDCDDTMADEGSRYEVRVLVEEEGVTGSRRFNGCGQYNGLGELTRMWELVEIDGEPVPTMPDMRRLPTIEFRLSKGGVSGNATCNRFSGEVTFASMTVTLGTLATTRMACPEMETESAYMKVLDSGDYTVTFDPDDHMQLKSDAGLLKYRLVGRETETDQGTIKRDGL